MPARGNRSLILSRRRRGHDDEEDGSVLDEVGDDSLTEDSGISDGENEHENDVEGSDASLDDTDALATTRTVNKEVDREHSTVDSVQPSRADGRRNEDSKLPSPRKTKSNGNIKSKHSSRDEIKEIGGTVPEPEHNPATSRITQSEDTVQRTGRREHEEYSKLRKDDPIFVPNKGGFFLHDDRTGAAQMNTRPFGRGRGRGPYPYNPQIPFREAADKPWTHDLHDRQEILSVTNTKPIENISAATIPKTSSPATTLNRSFSFSTTLGNVTVHVLLPGMPQKRSIPGVVRKHHTLLPQHRPPLRRDKPVRISIPDQQPRYIFPSIERSFIFIPRALRPNQQAYYRGRGRGSYHASRRTSLFGGSAYSPSAPVSRRSSTAFITNDGLRSPADSSLSRSGMVGGEAGRPIVRLPSAGFTPTEVQSSNGMTINGPLMSSGMIQPGLPIFPPMAQIRQTSGLPMHQPRPQKTVSVADIETPSSFPFQPPQQQQQQPFHQQMPAHVVAALGSEGTPPGTQASQPGPQRRTSLSHIPEGTVYATPLQSYAGPEVSQFWPNPYANMPMFYQSLENGMFYTMPMPNQALAPTFVPGMHAHPVPYMASGSSANPAAGPLPHESNGMVYYVDPTQFGGGNQANMPQYGMTPMAGMMNVPGQFYYAQMPDTMYYTAPSG